MKYFRICFVAFYISFASSLNPGEFQTCPANTHCTHLRGLIDFDWDSMSFSQKYQFGGRSWIIRPQGGQRTTITLVFKDFNIHQRMYIAIDSGRHMEWKQIFPTQEINFEMLITDVTSVTLYTPMSERGSFQVFYYVGCSILTQSSAEIKFPDMDDVVGLKSTCWVLKPLEVRDISRIYLSLRDVHLMEASISIEELHTDTKIAEVSNTTPSDIFARDTSANEVILIDLKCDDKLGTCEKFGNIFFLSYYAVDTSDVICIETQKHCALDPWYLPQPICSRTCPTLEHIIEEEFVKEHMPILKSAALDTSEEQGNTGTEEEEEEEEEDKVDTRIGTTKKPKSKLIRCQIKGKYCRCLKTQNDAKKFCFSRRKCKSFGSCAIACIWTRIILCAKITSSTSIKLLSG